MLDLYSLARPALFALDGEQAHTLTLKAMKTGILPKCKGVKDPALETSLWGLKFPNPVGLSAGFDKNAEVIAPAFGLGFGFVEAGTVTPKPQDGNPKPRIFRDPKNNAVINRMGFPNGGADLFKTNMESFLSRSERPNGVVGINIGMNKTQTDAAKDYSALIKLLGPMADYLTINISSPNTPGLRDLQKREPLMNLLTQVKDARTKACGDHPPPLLVKLAPDLDESQCEELAQTCIDADIDGLILSNTTLDRPEHLPKKFRNQTGGLSGTPVKDKSTRIIGTFYKLTKGKIPIIGVGGIESGTDAFEKIKAGASLVQIYSALVFHGPTLVNRINRELLELIKQDGHTHISDAVGTAHV